MMFSASRSRRLQIVPIIQSFSQLEKNYGKEGARDYRRQYPANYLRRICTAKYFCGNLVQSARQPHGYVRLSVEKQK